jgi:hypothetical protein
MATARRLAETDRTLIPGPVAAVIRAGHLSPLAWRFALYRMAGHMRDCTHIAPNPCDVADAIAGWLWLPAAPRAVGGLAWNDIHDALSSQASELLDASEARLR